MDHKIVSQHPQNKPGFSHSTGVTIIWDEIGQGARPETVLRMTLERIQYLDEILSCSENKKILYHLELAIEWEEIRSRRRKDQGIEGTLVPHKES